MLAQHVYSSNMTKRHVRENGLSTVRAVLHGYAGDKGDTRGIYYLHVTAPTQDQIGLRDAFGEVESGVLLCIL